LKYEWPWITSAYLQIELQRAVLAIGLALASSYRVKHWADLQNTGHLGELYICTV
jgi:hypothetical protein